MKKKKIISLISSILCSIAICGFMGLSLLKKDSTVSVVNAMSVSNLTNVTCNFNDVPPIISDFDYLDDLYSSESWNYDYNYDIELQGNIITSNFKQKYFIYDISTYLRPNNSINQFYTSKKLLILETYTYSNGVIGGEDYLNETESIVIRVFDSLEQLVFYNVNDDSNMPAISYNNFGRPVFSIGVSNGSLITNINTTYCISGDINFIDGIDVTNNKLLDVFNYLCTFKGYNGYTSDFLTQSQYQQIIDDLNSQISSLETSNHVLANQVETAYNQGYANAQHHYEVEMENYGRDKYLQGYGEGYREGFNADSTATTIFTGILSVAMVPINFFLGIFNFEILGINLSAFIKAIFTVMLTLIVVRVVLAKES